MLEQTVQTYGMPCPTCQKELKLPLSRGAHTGCAEAPQALHCTRAHLEIAHLEATSVSHSHEPDDAHYAKFAD